MFSFRSLTLMAGVTAIIVATPLASFAQTPAPVTATATVTLTGTITAIDYTARTVGLHFPDGTAATVAVSPAVTRFPALKVGDSVTFTETQSVVYSIAKPGAAPAPDAGSMAAAGGDKPGGMMTKTQTTIVTVTAIDMSVPSVTVLTADGRTVAFKVKDPKNLAGVKVGDKIQVAYTHSVMISVK